MSVLLLWSMLALAQDASPEEADGAGTEESAADEGEGTPVAPDAEEQGEVPLPPVDLTEAEESEGISPEQHAFLEPKRHLLEQNPYAEIDYTAYTLEFGEVKLGVASLWIGVLPRVQLGTSPVLDAVGIYNVNGKFNALRAGPAEFSVLGRYHVLPLGAFKASYVGAGAMSSVRVADPVSLHFGGIWGSVRAAGIPSSPPTFLKSLVNQEDIDRLAESAENLGVEPEVRGDAFFLRFAADYRLNRRDSILFQFQTIATGSITTTLGAEADEYVALLFPSASDAALGDGQQFLPQETYVATLSWQFAWQQLGLRLGGGWSADSISWLLQGNDLNYRMWGETRRDDSRRKRGWRKSKDEITE